MLTAAFVFAVVAIVAFAAVCVYAAMRAGSDMDRDSKTGRPFA